MNIKFTPFKEEHLPLWERWIEKPHVKKVWFIDGYHPPSNIHAKIKGNNYDHPFIIVADDQPIGYIQCCDLYAYRTICPKPKGLFTEEEPGTFCMDLFIAEEEYLNRGYGTATVKSFIDYVFKHFKAKKLLIDPATDNHRAMACYKKAGFTIVKEAFDGITPCTILETIRNMAELL
jgi:aminoglycoside 6'-N-acetyltransferase